MPDDVAPCGTGGVTLVPPSEKRKETRKAGSERWTFTWHNYDENWVALLAPCFEGSVGWIGGYEICPTTSTKHIQGYVEFGKKVRPVGYKGAPKQIHWGDEKGKPAKGTRAQNIAYCTKEERGYEGTFRPKRSLPSITMKGWQSKVVELYEGPTIQRRIWWFWSDARGIGKSDAVRWLCTQGALIVSGKGSDMKYLICKYEEKHGDYPECVVMDVPCSMQGFISYAGLEELCNGVFASTKYECANVIMPYAKVFLFCNSPPAMDNVDLSANRLEVYCIDEMLGKLDPWLEPSLAATAAQSE